MSITTTTMHDMAPTDAERAAIQAGLDFWLAVPWVDGETGRYVTEEAMNAVASDPIVLAGSAALRDWARRTCPAWCAGGHDRPRLPVLYISHSRQYGMVDGDGGTVSVTMDLTYDEEAETLVEGPVLNVWSDEGVTVTSAGARALAAILLEAADALEAAAEVD